VADATHRIVEELAADPSLLHGAVSRQMADLLSAHQDETIVIAEPEVEITATYLSQQPTLPDLVAQARRALQAESDADKHTSTGRVLAALLAGLRREELIEA
jgi:hypothetical protein